MIKIFVPFADRLNLNGDAANALILSKRLKWAGVDSLIVALTSENDFDSAIEEVQGSAQKHFVMVGHGSIAAMNSIAAYKSRISGLIDAVKSSGGCGLVVGSGYEWFKKHSASNRISEFRTSNLVLPGGSQALQVVGYVNSAANLPDCQWDGLVLLTRMHGPVLAKSTELADFFISRLTGSSPKASESASKIDLYVEEALAVARGERD